METKRYTPPRTQQGRIDEARGHIANLEATLRVGHNAYGEYGRNCRASIARWEATIADAQYQLSHGITKA